MKGHKNHESRMKHHGAHKRARGGAAESEAQEGPHQEETNEKKTEKMAKSAEYKGRNRAEREVKVEKKKGGPVERKRGGSVPGKAAATRLDKKPRGHSGSPKSPLSGADAPNLGYAKPNLKIDDGGKGKSVKAA